MLERVADPGPIGAGIVLQPTGQAVLARLGLLDDVAARASPLDRLWCRTPRGRTLVDLRYAKVDRAWFGLGVHRGVLFEALYGAARAEPNVTLVPGADVRGLRRDGARTFATIASGAEHGPFELVVVADGAVSELRDAAGATLARHAVSVGRAVVRRRRSGRHVRRRARAVPGRRARAPPVRRAARPGSARTATRRSSRCSGASRPLRSTRGATPASTRGSARCARSIRGSRPCSTRSRDPAQVLFARYRDVRMTALARSRRRVRRRRRARDVARSSARARTSRCSMRSRSPTAVAAAPSIDAALDAYHVGAAPPPARTTSA